MYRCGLIAAIALTAACGQASSRICVLPAALPSGAAPSSGCYGTIHVQVCDATADGSRRCRDACAPGEYVLDCLGAEPVEQDWLYCREVVVPTAGANQRFFCCTC